LTQQEWLMMQQRGGLLGGSRPIPGMFSNAQMMGGARGGGGMPMGMTSNTTGPAPEQTQEDPMATAYKMKMMYEGGQKGNKYIGDAWKKGKEWLNTDVVDESGIANIVQKRASSVPPVGSPTSIAPTQNIPSVGARKGFLPPQEVREPMLSHWNQQPMGTPSPGGLMDTSGDWMNAVTEGTPVDFSGRVADFGNISADPLTSGSGSLIQYPQPMNALGLESMPGSAGTLGSGGMFTPGTGTLNASTGVFTPAGGQLMGDAVGAGSKFAGGGFANAPKGAGMGNALGALGSAAGVGMNIYDMFDQGVTPGNMMGMLGSGMLGASALGSMGVMSGATAGLGLANAWNPIGWALLGGSIAGSLFDWW